MAIMRVTCELAGELRFSMAVMRRTALLEQRADRIVAIAVAPDVSSQSHRCAACSPLEDCRSPHRQTETGPLTGPGFLSGKGRLRRGHALAEARDSVGEIDDLRVGHRRQHLGHGGVVAVPRIVLVFAQRLDQIVLALSGDARNVFAAGQIETMTVVAAVLRDQRAAAGDARGIRRIARWWWWRRQLGQIVGE